MFGLCVIFDRRIVRGEGRGEGTGCLQVCGGWVGDGMDRSRFERGEFYAGSVEKQVPAGIQEGNGTPTVAALHQIVWGIPGWYFGPLRTVLLKKVFLWRILVEWADAVV